MKKQERYKIISYAKNEYNKIFNCEYNPTYKSKKDIESLLKQYNNSNMCRWEYCCYGLYKNCWQEPYFEGNWGMTQETVNKIILGVFEPKLLKKCRTHNRMFGYEKDNTVNLLIIARDLQDYKCDYLISFECKE